MAQNPLSDELLIDALYAWKRTGTIASAATVLNLSRTTAQHRIHKAQNKFPELLNNQDISKKNYHKSINGINNNEWTRNHTYAPEGEIKSVLIGGDAHIWPGEPSIMWKAFCKVAKSEKPDAIILNGDIIDGAMVSRHPRLLGSKAPKISEEIEAVQEHLKMLPRIKHKIWTLGNHDMRVDNYLANISADLEDYAGDFCSRFKDFNFAYAAMINGIEVRHRFRGGIHAGWNNALHSGISIITSHTHQLQVTAVRNRNGTHYGIECGMLADVHHPAFEYQEGAPSRVCPGFVYIQFDDESRMMPPEVCEMIRGRPAFRGKYLF